MAGCLDIALTWDRGNAVLAIAGDVWVDDLDAGESRVIYVDHSGTADFAFPLVPRIDSSQGDVDDVTIEVLAMATVGGTVRVTDGGGFVLQVTIDSGASGSDQGRGTSSWDWHLYWERIGVE